MPRRKLKRKIGDSNEKNNNPPREKQAYGPIIRENEDFLKYYEKQGIVDKSEWEDFIAHMKKDLPTAFRITPCSLAEAQRLLKIVKGEFFENLINPEENEERRLPKPLPWYPNDLGWQLDLPRKDIRRSALYFRLHNFLISETASGNISRQESVSMIPALLMDIQPHHKVLDMCAAPGSKTVQIIELLHSGQRVPDGLVIANDIDNSRCYMLVHQAKRLNSPAVMITNHDATNLPNFEIISKDNVKKNMRFDRVLCDVPCTGDGTLRKNPDIWLKWNSANGSNLHGIQYRVLKRGIELLETDGVLVYSTCSLNPVENEAVISRILKDSKGSLELLDVRDKLKGLITRPGLHKWWPASKDLTFYEKFEDVDEKWHTILRPHMFPGDSNLPLDRCLRILPHDQDTGCFFVAVLKKTALVNSGEEDKERSEAKPKDQKVEPRGGPTKRRKIQGYREDPFVFLHGNEDIWNSIRDFYCIEGLDPTLLLTRSRDGKKKNIYYVSSSIKELVSNNSERIKIINTGVKVFTRCFNKEMDCCFRLVQEGLFTIENFIQPNRRVKVNREDMIKLLENACPQDSVLFESLTEETRTQTIAISQGSCVLDYEEKTEDNVDLKFALVGWKGKKTLRVYISREDALHYLRVLGVHTEKLEINKYTKDVDKEENAGVCEASLDGEKERNDKRCDAENDENERKDKECDAENDENERKDKECDAKNDEKEMNHGDDKNKEKPKENSDETGGDRQLNNE